MAFSGQSARIVLGRKGLTGGKNPLSMDAASLLQAEGIRFEGEFISKQLGASRYNVTPLAGAPRIMSLWDWDATPSNQYLVAVTSDGKIYRDDGSGTFSVTMKSGLNINRVTHICEAGKEAATLPKKLFFFNGVNPIQVATGTSVTTTDIATPSIDWSGTNQPSFGVPHNGRVWVGGNANDPHRIYACDPDNHEVFTGTKAMSFLVHSSIGQGLNGGISYAGRLILFKRPRGIFWLDDSSLNVGDWRVLKLSDGVGLASPWAVIALEGDVMFKSPAGLYYMLSAVTATGGLTPAPMSNNDDLDVWLRDRVDPGQTGLACMVYHSSKLIAYSSCAQKGSIVNNMTLSYDLKQTDLRMAYSFRDKVQSLTIKRMSDGSYRLFMGDDAGVVWIGEQEQNNKGGQAYRGLFQLSHTDFSYLDAALADVRKRGKFIVVHFTPQGGHSMSIDILYDGIYSQTVHMPMGAVGAMLNSFVLGSDRLADNITRSRRKRIKGGGFRFSAICYNTGLNEDFHINEFVWQFVPSSRRERNT
jgi:hypothetical protein